MYLLHIPQTDLGSRILLPNYSPTSDIIVLTVSNNCSALVHFTSNMTSNLPASCCTVGVKHEGEAKGELQKIGDGIYYLEQHDLNC
jgi:hypothetical protein